MDNFNLYAKYYDLLYADKDYSEEVNYIDQLIKKFGNSMEKSILDLGCGTGIHANILTEFGYTVDGVDMSAEMVERANQKYSSNDRLRFFTGDITSYRNDENYDVVISLFHVMSYQNSNKELLGAIQTAFEHLKPGGLFIFDYWYGPAVLTDLPETREKQMENDEIRVLRKAIPEMHYNMNVVDVNYSINITNKANSSSENVNEQHSMRYLFEPELQYFLDHVGFVGCEFYEWLKFQKPGVESWNALTIAKKGI